MNPAAFVIIPFFFSAPSVDTEALGQSLNLKHAAENLEEEHDEHKHADKIKPHTHTHTHTSVWK